MKYFLAILASLCVLGCVSSQNQGGAKASKTKTAIVDEEFDSRVAPEYDYEANVPYAQQIKLTTDNSASNKNASKPSKQPAATKVN